MTTDNSSTEKRVTAHWQRIVERRAKIVAARLGGARYVDIAKSMGLTKTVVRRIARTAFEKGEMTFDQYSKHPEEKACTPALSDSAYAAKFLERLVLSIKVDERGCWLWQKCISTKGYGLTQYRGRPITAHRKLYEVINGVKLKTEQFVCHKCDVPACVNPAHLFLGDNDVNMADKTRKGRHHEQKVTHCPRGHAYDSINTYITPSGARACKTCTNERNRARQAKKRLAA